MDFKDMIAKAGSVASLIQFLVVDESVINAKILVRLLEKKLAQYAFPAQIDTAYSGKSALLKVQSKEYDMLLVEPEMAEMSGATFLRYIRDLEEETGRRVPVVAVTALVKPTEGETYYRNNGYDVFINRPVKWEALESVLKSFWPGVVWQISDPAEGYIELPQVEDVDWSLGESHFPKREMLYEAIVDFYKAVELEADTLEAFYFQIKQSQDALEEYRIKVHAMKSTANLIGAAKLGEAARQLEDAAREGNLALVNEGTEKFLGEWRSYKEKLKDCVAVIQGDSKAEDLKEEVQDTSVIIAYLEMLRVAMLEMDIDGMDGAMEKLESFRFEEAQEKKIEKLSVCVTNMDIEQAAVLIEELINDNMQQA